MNNQLKDLEGIGKQHRVLTLYCYPNDIPISEEARMNALWIRCKKVSSEK